MKIKYYKLRHWLLATAAGLLGLNVGCERVIQCEYGCPEADYEVKGRVTTQGDVPIEGIEVSLNSYYADTSADTSDADGRYDLSYRGFPPMGDERDTVKVTFADIDGEANGHYADTTVQVVFHRSDLQGGDGHWYEGRATKEVDVKLREVSDCLNARMC